jgi:hypothetical protein
MSLFHDGAARLARVMLLLALLKSPADARGWDDVIAVSIYAQSHVDIARLQFSLEDDPLSSILAYTSLDDSMPPSDAPSSVPSSYRTETEFEQQQQLSEGLTVTNEKCLEGGSSYDIKRIDSAGVETLISIRQVGDEIVTESSYSQYRRPTNVADEEYNPFIVRSQMEAGLDSQEICLSYSSCYEVVLQGGGWQEATWEIIPVSLDNGTSPNQEARVRGQGFSNCTFQLTDGSLGSSRG